MLEGAENFRRVAVLGAGDMGLQLAAHLANAHTEVVLFDLAHTGANPCASLHHKLKALIQLQPPAFALPEYSRAIIPATFQHDLALLRECDLIIETTAELGDCKEGVLARVAPYLNKRAVITTTTDTVSIERLARALPEPLRSRFCGMHFLMPPRYTRLVELAASSHTDMRVLEQLACFAVSVLGKQVVRVKDSPLYIADRLAVSLFCIGWRTALHFNLALETIDALLERTFGLPTGGLFSVIDQYGVGCFVRLLEEARIALPHDPWLAGAHWPEVVQGKESSSATVFYTQQANQWSSLDPSTGDYRPLLSDPLGELLNTLEPTEWWQAVHQSNAEQMQFLRAFIAELCLYSALHLDQLARSCAEFDLAVRFAFGAKIGVFELWQKLGWKEVQAWLPPKDRYPSGPEFPEWPDWVKHKGAAYSRKGVYVPEHNEYQPYVFESAYQRQIQLPELPGSEQQQLAQINRPHFGFSIWQTGSQTTLLSIWDCAALQRAAVLQDLQSVFSDLFKTHKTVVLALQGLPAGHERYPIEPSLEGCLQALEALYLQLRYAPIPVIATLSGAITGPALALALACTQRVCAQNTRVFAGLDNNSADIYLPAVAGIGHALIGQLAEIPTLLARQNQAACYVGTLLSTPLSIGAEEARQLGILHAADTILLNPAELSGAALAKSQQCQALGYRAPPRWSVPVLGRDSIESVHSLFADQFADSPLAAGAAVWKMPLIRLLCGGDQPANSLLNDQALLRLECAAYSHRKIV